MITLLEKLEKRFTENSFRHPNTSWEMVKGHLNPKNLNVIAKMDELGGEPDCIEYDGTLLYVDMAKESPIKRRSLCYDQEARMSRKKFPPQSSVTEELVKIGSCLVDETLYLFLQTIEPLDQKTSSWLKTNNEVRDLNGAIFGDFRFGRAFIFHNSADSYYKDRGFRSYITIN